jgi:hypothetical protein
VVDRLPLAARRLGDDPQVGVGRVGNGDVDEYGERIASMRPSLLLFLEVEHVKFTYEIVRGGSPADEAA